METKAILDTSVMVDFIRNRNDAIQKISKLSQEYELCTTDINIFELYYGAYISSQTDKNLAAVKGLSNTLTIFSTSEESMEISAKIMSELKSGGQSVELKDIFIAGICLCNSCPIVTQNKKHFERAGTKIIDI